MKRLILVIAAAVAIFASLPFVLPPKLYRGIFYPSGRPRNWTSALNRAWGRVHGTGLLPSFLAELEVRGWKTGKAYRCPVVLADYAGERYIVSMLGERATWVRNVRASGEAVLRHGVSEHVRALEVPPGERAPILKAYLGRAPGGRPHIPVDRDAPIEEFDRVAAQYPVFRVEPL
jgi:deazaflavin-dependent oxidoreductase (nitroreductase family)